MARFVPDKDKVWVWLNKKRYRMGGLEYGPVLESGDDMPDRQRFIAFTAHIPGGMGDHEFLARLQMAIALLPGNAGIVRHVTIV
jgi:hypothetical protein